MNFYEKFWRFVYTVASCWLTGRCREVISAVGIRFSGHCRCTEEAVGQGLTVMLFLTSELANNAEIAILSARDTTRAWVPGRGIMGRNVGVYKNGYNTWLSSRLQNQARSFRFVLFNFFLCLVFSFSGTMHPVWQDRLF